jgi:hypothetical protein
MRCPGQDRSFWTGEVAFETPCPKCGAAVEFFRDETSGHCPNCGHRFQNPRMEFDCGKWCSFAEKCLGFVAEREATSDPAAGALAGRLIRAIKEEFDGDQARIARTLMVFRQARELVSKEGGDPRIILASTLLLEIGVDQPADEVKPAATRRVPPPQKTRGTARARQILEDVGLDQGTTDCVCQLLDSRRMGKQLDTIEFKVVADSEVLAKLAAAAEAGGDRRRLLEIAEDRLKTPSGKQRARRLFQGPAGESGGK